MPLAPRAQTHPPRAHGADRRAKAPAGPGSGACFVSQDPVGLRTRAPKLVVRSGPEGGERGAGRGCPARSGQGPPALGTPSPTPAPSSCAGASPTENENSGRGNGGRRSACKTRTKGAGLPPPLPGRGGPGTAGSGRCPLPWRSRAPPGPLPTSLLPAPPPSPAQGSSRSGPCSARHQPTFLAAVPEVPAPCAPGCARPAGALRPRPCRQPPGCAWIRPLPWSSAVTWGGRGSGRGGIPTRQKATPFIGRQLRLCGQGTAEGAGRTGRGGAGGGGAERGVGPPRGSSPFAPPPSLPTGLTRSLSVAQLTGKGAEAGGELAAEGRAQLGEER